MPNSIPIPDDFQHLIEKRSGEDRRQQEHEVCDNSEGPNQADDPSVAEGSSERRSSGVGRRKGDQD